MKIEFNTNTWYSNWATIIALLIYVPIQSFYIGREYERTVSVIESNSIEVNDHVFFLTKVDPFNATYEIDGQKVTLNKGVSEKGGETHIFGKPEKGDINNDGRLDSVFFLYEDTGGTGTFFYAAAAISEGEKYKGTKAIFLGDRISPQNISIDNKGVISVNYAIRKDTDPMTTPPSVGVTKRLMIKSGELVEQK